MKNSLLILVVVILITSCKDIRKEYYSDGVISCEVEYKENERNGLARWYYPNGDIKIEANYINDKEEGQYKGYYEGGKLSTVVYFKEGLQNGDFVEYYRNGNLKSEQYYTKGVQDKVNKFYFSNQQLEMEAFYNNGKTIYWVEYDSLGNWLDEFMWIEVTTNDTVYLGEEYSVRLVVPGPKITKKDKSVCFFDIFDSENKTQIEHEAFFVKDNLIPFSYTANRLGNFSYSGVVLTNDGTEKRKEHKIEMGNIYVVDKVVNETKQ